MDARTTGLLLAAAGVVVVVLGLLVASGALAWFGRLPGDFRWSSGNTRVYVPITTMVLVSLVLTLLSYLLRRLL